MRAPRLTTAALLAFAGSAGAIDWPGVSPCDTALDTCINASPAGSVIDIVGNDRFLAGLSITNSVTLRSPPGRRARFQTNQRITIAQSSDVLPLHVTLQGMDMPRGVVYIVSDDDAVLMDVTLADMRFDNFQHDGSEPLPMVDVTHRSDSELQLTVRDSEFRADTGDFGLPAGAAKFIRVAVPNIFGDQASITLTGNRFDAEAPPAAAADAIDIMTGRKTGTSTLIIDGNTFALAGFASAIRLDNLGSINRVLIASNDIHARTPGARAAEQGIYTLDSNHAPVRVINNTILDTGIAVSLPAVRYGVALNNLLGWNAQAIVRDNELVHENNLFWANADNGVPGDSENLFVDPRLVSRQAPRLTDASPAIGQGSPLPEPPNDFIPLPVDADGLRRRKGERDDIGAYEWGERSLRVIAPTPASATIDIDDTRSNGQTDAHFVATRVDLADRFDTIDAIDDRYSLAYAIDSGRWRLRTDNDATITPGGSFAVLIAEGDAGVFEHAANAANIVGPRTLTPIDAFINIEHTAKIALATPTRGWQGTGVLNPHGAMATFAFTNRWYVLNVDGAAMPVGTRFDMYSQYRSRNAFIHTATVHSVHESRTWIDHPRINDNPCAAVYTGLAAGRMVSTVYSREAGRWSLRYDDGLGPVLVGHQFFVLVDPAGVQNCVLPAYPDDLLRNGFE